MPDNPIDNFHCFQLERQTAGEDVRVRRAAARAMREVLPAVKDPETRARAVEPLIRAMKDRDVTPRCQNSGQDWRDRGNCKVWECG